MSVSPTSLPPSILLSPSKPQAQPSVIAAKPDHDGDADDRTGAVDSDGDRGNHLNIKA